MMALLPSGTIVVLDKNITDKKNVTLEYILNNSRNKFIEEESNVEWGVVGFNRLDDRDLGWISLGPTGICNIISGSMDDLPIYEIHLQIYNPKSSP
jgi:hypothetical protein